MFLRSSLGACAAGALFDPVPGRSGVAAYYKAIFDERFGHARAFAGAAAQRGIETASIRGDITRLFFDDLDLRWKQGPVRLAGYTTEASLFCLDLLARDRCMRVSYRAAEPALEEALVVLDGALPSRGMTEPSPAGGPSVLVVWIIEAKPRLS